MKIHFFVLTLFPVILSSQPTITQSLPFEALDVTNTLGLVRNGQDDNMLLIYHSRVEDHFGLKSYGHYWAADVIAPNLEKRSNNEPKKIKLPTGKYASNGVFLEFGGPALLLRQHEEKEKKMSLYRCAIEPNGTIKEPLFVCDYYAGKSDWTSQEYHALSSDSSMFLSVYKPPVTARGEPFSFAIISKEWTPLRAGILVPPPINAEIKLGAFFLAADTSVWLPVWVREKGKKNDIRQELWVWWNPNVEPYRIDISLSDEQIVSTMMLTQSPYDKCIYLGGTFAKATSAIARRLFTEAPPATDLHPKQGYFLIKMTPKGDFQFKQSKTFEASTLIYWRMLPADIKKGRGIKHITPWKIHPQPDGSTWLNLEGIYNSAGPVNKNSGLTTSGNYFSGSAISVHLDPHGKSSQELVIPKFANSIHGSGLRYLMLVHKGKPVFLFNDHEKNLNQNRAIDLKLARMIDISGLSVGPSNVYAMIHYQDENNRFKTEKLFDHKEAKYWLNPECVLQLSPTTYIIGCNGRMGNFGLLRVDLPE